MKKVVIVGGGFAGIKCALELSKLNPSDTKVILISDKPHFEYHAALYRIVTDGSPMEVCIPLGQIFSKTNTEVLRDKITNIDIKGKKLIGDSGAHYTYDFLVLGLGSETEYFNIPGLNENAFGLKSIQEALRLKKHIHESLLVCAATTGDERMCAAQFVVVGAGASGTELSAQLAMYLKRIAKNHGIESSMITLDLIDIAPRILSNMPMDFATKIEKQLRELGVNIFLNRGILRNDVDQIVLQNMDLRSKTLIWTAGIKAHHLYREINGLEINRRGQVEVINLNPKGFDDVFIVGDGAETKYSGMAQTALYDGKYAAKRIAASIKGKNGIIEYAPKAPYYAIPVGYSWAGIVIGNLRAYGKMGWWIRRLADLAVFCSILPLSKALDVFRDGRSICETCSICESAESDRINS